jgi:hypothetical protein
MTQTTATQGTPQEPKVPGIFQEMKSAIMLNVDSASAKPDAWQPYNAATGRSFDGAARLRLATAGFDDPRWLTEKQAERAGVIIRPEAKEQGVRVYFYEKGENNSVALKTYTLFNAQQIDGLSVYRAMTPEKANDALRATAEKNHVEAGKGVKSEKLAEAIIHQKMGELKGTPEENVAARLAVEFLKAEHGIKVDVTNLRDAFRALPEKTTGKMLMNCANDAGKYSRQAIESCEILNKIEKQTVVLAETPARTQSKGQSRGQSM